MTTAATIRREFIEFFESKQHHFVRSAPVVPLDDPTLLFTNAGMNQFKDVFLATGTRDYTRAANSQKCIRASGKHNDLEDVGRDNYHHTFFEMLGNWSFGDYFKEEAIGWSWELCVDQWGLPADRLWATVFEGSEAEKLDPDTEAESLWKSIPGLPKSQILRCSKKDNFWEMGEWGPCGPCSELHLDLGEGTCPLSKQHQCGVNVDGCWRYIELWNLVFIQYNRQPSGELESLPQKHVDTGMGLERMCRVLQKVDSNYHTDLFTPLLGAIADITKQAVQPGETEVAFHVIADHIRALSFAIADGALPSNEGRGYVLRRMLRRAVRFGRVLNMEEPFIYRLVPALAETMGEAFPEIEAQQKHVANVIQAEEESFGSTLGRGLEIFQQMVQQHKEQKQSVFSGEDAFKLYDTYGFPMDLTRLMCDENSLSIDEDSFEACMKVQRDRARSSAKFVSQQEDWTILQEGDHSQFLGYNTFELDTNVCQFSKSDKQLLMVLGQTPFYAESGGQVADHGTLTQGSRSWNVTHVYKEGNAIVHVCDGNEIPDTTPIHAAIDDTRRQQATNNHTATHLMHAALHQVIGDHAKQAGSIVHPEYLRFDFTHFEKISTEDLDRIEQMVNEEIRKNTPLNIYETSYDEAIASGVNALFGEKYGDHVRVVTVGDFSNELCGGCHVPATGVIGSFRITSESSIATGVRRITAITGNAAETLARQESKVVQEIKQLLNLNVDALPAQVAQLLEDKRQLEKAVAAYQSQSSLQEVDQVIKEAKTLNGIAVMSRLVQVESVDALKQLADAIRQKQSQSITVLAAVIQEKATLLCAVSDDLLKQKIKAGDVVNLVAAVADGRGGGKPHMAQAGTKSPEKLPEAIRQAPELIESYLKERA